jgi:hypothetical protein
LLPFPPLNVWLIAEIKVGGLDTHEMFQPPTPFGVTVQGLGSASAARVIAATANAVATAMNHPARCTVRKTYATEAR